MRRMLSVNTTPSGQLDLDALIRREGDEDDDAEPDESVEDDDAAADDGPDEDHPGGGED
jgi:hypothetical protein